jgi:H+/Cl- antiporter ClcA
MLGFFMESDFLRFFIDNIEPDDWADTAMSWLTVAIVVAVLGAGLIFAFKAGRKSMAHIAKNKIWTRGQTWLLILIGIFPIFLTLLVVWYMSRDYFNFIQIGGLLKGTLFAWLIYLFLMVTGHLVSPWRRELI